MASLVGKPLGRYLLMEQVGLGGMAAVYKAYDARENRVVALKVLATVLAEDAKFSLRFQREAKIVSDLIHPNIVPVWDYGEADGRAYLVMPFLSVGSLADRLRNGPLQPSECGRIFGQVASALEFAHSRGVVHRDLKPSNILLDEKGNALLSDFGLAQIQDASISLTGSALLGTPAYLSPEQARGDKVEARSDQYSLGIILFQLSTGQLPFDAETPMAVAIKQVHEPLPLPRKVNPNVPEVVERVILKATAKDPNDRFPSVAEMNRAFQAALGHVLDPSSPPPKVPLPASLRTMPLPAAATSRQRAPAGRRKRAVVVALLSLGLVLCAFASSALASRIVARSTSTPSPALVAQADYVQLTALAATIEDLSTQIAAGGGLEPAPELLQSALVRTLTAMAVTSTPEATFSSAAQPGPTGTAEPSVTPTRTASRTATTTRSVTPVPSETAVPSPSTGSIVLPSSTTTATTEPVPTATATPTQTASPTPPPPTEDPCSRLSVEGNGVRRRKVSWRIVNAGTSSFILSALHLDWPSSNDDLEEITLNDDTIYDRTDREPPTDITSGWKSGGSREVAPGSTADLVFIFSRYAAETGYSLGLTFSGGCQVGAGQ
ncbi:MAG: protein kinase [Chloroflexota bacterium]